MPSLRALDGPDRGLGWESNQYGLVLMDYKRRRALATFRSEYTPDYFEPYGNGFTSDGRYVLGTTSAGELVVIDLVAAQKRVAEFQMGW